MDESTKHTEGHNPADSTLNTNGESWEDPSSFWNAFEQEQDGAKDENSRTMAPHESVAQEDDAASIRRQEFLDLAPRSAPTTQPDAATQPGASRRDPEAVAEWVYSQPQSQVYRNPLTTSVRSNFSIWTVSSGQMSEYGAAWPEALDRTMNSGFGVGAPRNKDRVLVREGREKGPWLSRIKGVGRTGKGPMAVPQYMLKALGVKLTETKEAPMEDLKEVEEPPDDNASDIFDPTKEREWRLNDQTEEKSRYPAPPGLMWDDPYGLMVLRSTIECELDAVVTDLIKIGHNLQRQLHYWGLECKYGNTADDLRQTLRQHGISPSGSLQEARELWGQSWRLSPKTEQENAWKLWRQTEQAKSSQL